LVVEEDVGRLDVSVGAADPVEVVDAGDQLLEVFASFELF
jgi:hypothetical protein